MNENFLVLLGLGNTAKAEGKSLVGQIDAVLPRRNVPSVTLMDVSRMLKQLQRERLK